MEELILECREKMEKCLESLKGNLATIRAGKVSPMILDRIYVNYYGEDTPLKAIASITNSSATSLLVRPFDPSSLKDVQKALGESDLGLNPIVDGGVIRLNFPPLTSERREEFVKQAHKYCEDNKVAVRNIRRDYNNFVKQDKDLSEDYAKRLNDDIQKATDEYVSKIDAIFAAKKKDLEAI